MSDFLATHTWVCCTSVFWTLKAAFVLMCFVGAAMTIIWLVGVAIGSYFTSQYHRSRRHYRVLP
jgi:hypothetical protein